MTKEKQFDRLTKLMRQITWEKELARVQTITDDIGRTVDEGVVETVAIFSIYGLPTTNSCEGHFDRSLWPRVEVDSGIPVGWFDMADEEQIAAGKVWKIENLKHQQKTIDLLAGFYQNRETVFDARLTFNSNWAMGDFVVQSLGAEAINLLPDTERRQKLELYQKEMQDFTNFLKNKYISEGLPE